MLAQLPARPSDTRRADATPAAQISHSGAERMARPTTRPALIAAVREHNLGHCRLRRRACRHGDLGSAWPLRSGQAESFRGSQCLPRGTGEVSGDYIGGMPVETAAGTYWRTQRLELSEYPAEVPEFRRPTSLALLDALEENPRIASTVWRADPALEGIAPETCLVRRPLPEGLKRYSDTIVTS